MAKGQILADGPCTDMGELALGRNVLVAFMPWRGYNFEDAILVSEKLVKEDMYTSIHIEEFEIEARDTKLGPEEVTRDIPNVSEAPAEQPGRERHHPHRRQRASRATSWWARSRPRARPSSPPRRSCCAPSSARRPATCATPPSCCPPGIEGIVVDVKIFSRKGVEKDERARQIEDAELFMMEKNLKDEIRILQDERDKRIEDLLDGKTATADLVNARGDKVVKKGDKLTPRGAAAACATPTS